MVTLASKVCLSSIIPDVSFTSQHQHHHHSLHPKTLHFSRIVISFPFKSGTPYSHPLVVFSTTTLSSSSPSSSNNTTNFSNYLVNTLGFSEQQSLSTSTKLIKFWQGRVPRKVTTFGFLNNAELVVTFLKQTGLDESQIRNAITQYPRILFANVDKTLKPKINLLQELGLSGPEIARILSTSPFVLISRLNLTVKSLRAVLGSDDKVAKVIKRSNWNYGRSIDKCLVPNVELLVSYGVPRERIRKAILRRPTAFMRSTQSFQDVLNRVEEKWGIPRDSVAFVYAVQLMSGYKEENIDSKCEIFKSFGWTDSDILALVRVSPFFLLSSETRIRNSLEFLMNELGYTPSYLTSTSTLFTCSVEKRLVPRHRVLQILKDKGFVKADYKLCSAAVLTESDFLEKFIEPFKEAVPDLHEIYVNLQQRSSSVDVKEGESELSSPQTETDMLSSVSILSESQVVGEICSAI